MSVDERYEIIYPLNSDETAFVARERESGAFVVFKEIIREVVPVYRELEKLSPKGVPLVLDIIEGESACYIAEELICGVSLEEYMYKGEISPLFVRRCAAEICRILMPIHRKGIIHRDINPNNILIRPDGHFMLVDFGISRIVKPGAEKDTTIMGTKGYVAPEQFGFTQTRQTADIYSIGAVIKELCRMCDYDSITLGMIADKCMSIKPEERYKSVSALYNALGRCGSGNDKRGIDAVIAAVPFARSENETRNRVVFGCVTAVLIISGLILYPQVSSFEMLFQMTAGIVLWLIVPYITIGNWGRIKEYNPLLGLFSPDTRTVLMIIFMAGAIETGVILIKGAMAG